jgi:hypothetical protein
MSHTFYFRIMSLGDPNSFRDLEVSVPDDLSELANKTRADLGEEEQLEANSHPNLPTSFDIGELLSHWDGKRKENPSGADEHEAPAKRNQLQPRCTGESVLPNPGPQQTPDGAGRQRARFRNRHQRLRPVDPSEGGAVPAPSLPAPRRFFVSGIPSGGQTAQALSQEFSQKMQTFSVDLRRGQGCDGQD